MTTIDLRARTRSARPPLPGRETTAAVASSSESTTPPEQELRPHVLTSRQYPGASQPGDSEGVLIVGPTGGVAAGPYQDEAFAAAILKDYPTGWKLERCRIVPLR